jgi:hypothetical protein
MGLFSRERYTLRRKKLETLDYLAERWEARPGTQSATAFA